MYEICIPALPPTPECFDTSDKLSATPASLFLMLQLSNQGGLEIKKNL